MDLVGFVHRVLVMPTYQTLDFTSHEFFLWFSSTSHECLCVDITKFFFSLYEGVWINLCTIRIGWSINSERKGGDGIVFYESETSNLWNYNHETVTLTPNINNKRSEGQLNLASKLDNYEFLIMLDLFFHLPSNKLHRCLYVWASRHHNFCGLLSGNKLIKARPNEYCLARMKLIFVIWKGKDHNRTLCMISNGHVYELISISIDNKIHYLRRIFHHTNVHKKADKHLFSYLSLFDHICILSLASQQWI